MHQLIRLVVTTAVLFVFISGAVPIQAGVMNSAQGQVLSNVTGTISLTFQSGYTQVFELAQSGDATLNTFGDGSAQLTRMKLVEPFSQESAGTLELNGFGRYAAEGGFAYDTVLTARTPAGTFSWSMVLQRMNSTVEDPGMGTYASIDAPVAVGNKNVSLVVEVILQLPGIDQGVGIASRSEDFGGPASPHHPALPAPVNATGGGRFGGSSFSNGRPRNNASPWGPQGSGGMGGGGGGYGGFGSGGGASRGNQLAFNGAIFPPKTLNDLTSNTTLTGGAQTGDPSNPGASMPTATTPGELAGNPPGTSPMEPENNRQNPGEPDPTNPTTVDPGTSNPLPGAPATLVPEPSSIILWSAALAITLVARRRRMA